MPNPTDHLSHEKPAPHLTSQQVLFEELLVKIAARWAGLPDKPDENPENNLRALWLATLGKPLSVKQLASGDLPALDEAAESRLRELVDQRMSGVPLAHLTGRQSFMGVEMLAGPEAMIPRQETEILGNAALAILKTLVEQRGSAQVIDLCTGSGNLALVLAFRVPGCQVVGVDLSREAVELARRNAGHLGLTGRVQFREGDLFSPLESTDFWGQADMVVCNPPYISSAQVEALPHEIAGFEPRLAFDGGPFGVKILTRLIREAPRFLKPASWLCFEVGLGQGRMMTSMLGKSPKYGQVQTLCDEGGNLRALAALTQVSDDGDQPLGAQNQQPR